MSAEVNTITMHHTPIDPTTGLATDFLNQYNEVTMILEMLPDMPELFEDIRGWKPKTYQQHFIASGFRDYQNVIDAYEDAPPQFKNPFDNISSELNGVLIEGLELISGCIGEAEPEEIAALVAQTQMLATQHMEKLNGLIHGRDVADADHAEVEEGISSQADIDALFD